MLDELPHKTTKLRYQVNGSGDVNDPLLTFLFRWVFIIGWHTEEVTEVLDEEKDLENLQRCEPQSGPPTRYE